MSWIPSACTLPTADRPARVAEFEDLFRNAVRSIERSGPDLLRLHLVGDETTRRDVEDLIARESACCSFFTFELTSQQDGARLDVRVPGSQTAVLDAIQGRAAAATGRPS